MNYSDIVRFRLFSQQLNDTAILKADDMVRWMGCIQSQDYNAAKWSIGNRIKGITSAAIDRDFNEGRILRTHVLRPTWHFIAPDDIRWILNLTAAKIRAFLTPYYKKHGIDTKHLTASKKLFEKALTGGNQLTRTELAGLLKKKKLDTRDIRMAFHLMDAELVGLICSGPIKSKQFTYALLDERVPVFKQLNENEALGELAKRYYQSRGPATVKDFCWWSGLNLTKASQGIVMNEKDLICEKINGDDYWFFPVSGVPAKSTGIKLLPSFDEYAIGYKDRSAILDPKHHISSGYGILKPVIVQNGKIAGVWKKTKEKGRMVFQNDLFVTLNKTNSASLKKAEKDYDRFLAVE
jgi:hypothetical protein